MTRDETREWLRKYYLAALGGVENLITFVEKYRSYVVTYTTGRQLVREYVNKHSAPGDDLARRWQLFHTLLSTPQTPSGLMELGVRQETTQTRGDGSQRGGIPSRR